MTEFGRELILNGDVKYIGEGEDPAENPIMKAYAKSLKEVYQPERSKREDSILEEATKEFRQFLDETFDRRMEIVDQLQKERDAVL